MPLTTRGLPYPSAFDDPDVPNDMGALALAIDPLLPPIGMISMTAAQSAPTGWLLCQGQPVSRTTYSALYALIGDYYGAGDGSTTFNIPNLKGRVPVGLNDADADFDTIGETGGSKAHTHTNTSTGAAGAHLHSIDPPETTSTSDSHSHTAPSHTHAGPSHTHTGPSHTHTTNPPTATSSSAGSHSHTDTTGGPSQSYDGLGTSGGFAASSSHTHSVSTSSNGSHTHTVSIGDITSSSSGTASTGAGGTGPTGAPIYTAPVTSATSSDAHDHKTNILAFDSATAADHTHTQGATGSTLNMPPFVVLNYIIKAV